MRFSRSMLMVCPMVCALAQTPPGTGTTPAPAAGNSEQPAPNSHSHQIVIPPPPPQVPPETVVLTVGDVTLTAAEFDTIADALPEQSKAFVKGPGRKMFADQIAKVLILAEEGRRRKLDQAADFQLQDKYRTDELLANHTEAAIRDGIKIDDAMLRDYYEAHKAEYERVRARHILIRMHGSPIPLKAGAQDLTDAEALAKAQGLIERIKAGEDFAKLAAAESDDTGAAANGGDLGWFGRGQMVPSFEEAAFRLKPGQLSDPVQSQVGYHIIQVEGQEFKSFDEMKATIEKKILPEQTQKALDEMKSRIPVVYHPTFFEPAKQ